MAPPRQRWVVISNCQSFGLADCITALGPGVDCEPCEMRDFIALTARDPDHFRGHDFALVLPDIRELDGFRPETLPAQHIDMPAFMFGGYHPDCCYVFADGEVLHGPVGPYHSMIALAAFKEGLTAEAAVRCFGNAMYEAAGYPLHWDAHRDYLIGAFGASGLAIGPLFRRLGRGRCFMHTTDHPKIELFAALAEQVLRVRGQRIAEGAPLPADGLAGMSWPVYPEIGLWLGVRGSYHFRTSSKARPLDLPAYLDAAFATFGAWDKSQLRVIPGIQRRLQIIRRLIREGL